MFFVGYYGQLVLNFAILAIASVGLRWTMLAGQFSLAHAGFMAAAAYTSVVVTTRLGLSFWLALAAGVGVAAAVAVVVSLMSWRLRGLYLAISTLAFAEAFLVGLEHTSFVGGPLGMSAPFLASPATILIALALLIVSSTAVERSRFAKSFRAVSDDEVAASASGMNVKAIKTTAFVVGAAVTGVAGVFFAHRLGNISPQDFGFGYVLLMLFSVLIGGSGRPLGPVVGAAIVIALPELIRPFGIDRALLFGPVLVLLLIVRPDGILLQRFGDRRRPVWRSLLTSRPPAGPDVVGAAPVPREPGPGPGPTAPNGDAAREVEQRP